MNSAIETKIGPQKVENNQLLVGLGARALIFWAENLIIRKEIKGKENLQEAVNHINAGRGGLIVTPRHESYIDAEVMREVRKTIKNRAIKFPVLWANKFTGKDEGKYSGTGEEDLGKVILVGKIGKKAAENIGIELIDIPQETKDFESSRDAIRVIREKGKGNLGQNNVLGVFPEGTRSRNGMLGIAKRALAILFEDPEINSKTLILPVGLTGTAEYLPPKLKDEKLNIFAKVTIIYGKPYTYAQMQEEIEMYRPLLEAFITKQERKEGHEGEMSKKRMDQFLITTIMMWHIGQLLPKEDWGYYEEIFSAIQADQEQARV